MWLSEMPDFKKSYLFISFLKMHPSGHVNWQPWYTLGKGKNGFCWAGDMTIMWGTEGLAQMLMAPNKVPLIWETLGWAGRCFLPTL